MAKQEDMNKKNKPNGPSGPGKGVPPKFSRGIMVWLVGIMLAAVLIAVVAQPWDRKTWTLPEFWDAKEEQWTFDKVALRDTAIEGKVTGEDGIEISFVVELPTGLVGHPEFHDKLLAEPNPIKYGFQRIMI